MVGQTQPWHSAPQTMRGGINYYPVSGIIEGVTVVDVNINNPINPTNLELTLTVGSVRLEGNKVSQPLTALTIPVQFMVDFNYGEKFTVYINPTRLVPFVDMNDAAPAVITGGHYLRGTELPDYILVENIYTEESNVWRTFDYMRDFSQGDYGWNNLPFNSIDNTPLAADNFSLHPEKAMFLNSRLAPHISRPSLAKLRQTASIPLAEITFFSASNKIIENTKDVDLVLI
jgi:hypothetical protein